MHCLFRVLAFRHIDILIIWKIKVKEVLLWGRYTEMQYGILSTNLKCAICGNLTIIKNKYHESTKIIGIAWISRECEYNQKRLMLLNIMQIIIQKSFD